MKTIQLNITIKKEGEDVDLGNTKHFLKLITELIEKEGFQSSVDMQSDWEDDPKPRGLKKLFSR